MDGVALQTMTTGWLATGIGAYGLTAAVAGIGEFVRKPALRRAGFVLMIVACVINVMMIATMWLNLGRPPFWTRYETLLLYPLCVAVVSIMLVALHRLWLLTAVCAAGAVIFLEYARRHPDLEASMLMPALQSAWFVPHVIAYFVGYGGLTVSCVLAALALIINWRNAQPARMPADPAAPIPLELASHKAAIFGFVALTVGLAMGAVWAKTAWGDYWSWDPKENWALITWLVYLSYCHIRLVAGWRGKGALFVNIACFAAIMFTWLGMHLLPTAESSIHIYQQ